MNQNSQDALELLVKHELAIKKLYEIFAAKFMNHRGFWTAIADDEQSHADHLESIRSVLAIPKWLWFKDRFKAAAIQASITYVEKQAADAEAGRITELRALSIGRDIESALLEKMFARAGDNVPQEIKSILQRVIADSERHRRSIVELLDSEKR